MALELWKEPVVIAASILLLIIARVAYKRNRITGCPPIVSYTIPWVGSAIDIGNNPDAFFKRAINEHGDVFTIKVLGQTMTYVTSPKLIAEVYRNPQKYSSSQPRGSVYTDVFRMSDKFVHSPVLQETIFPMSHKLLSPKHVQSAVDKYTALTYQHLEERANQYNGMNVALRDFIVPLTFDASSRAFFGKDCPVNDLFKPFKLFDDNVHLILAGVPKMFVKGPVTALDDLATIIEEKYLSKPNAMDDASDLVKEFERIIKEEGHSKRDLARLAVMFLWGLQANAPLGAYWLIALNLQQPDGLKPLVAEIDEAVARWNTTNSSLPLDSHQNIVDFVNQADLPLVNSTIQETLRFATSSMSMRGVMETTELGGHTLNQGDLVICWTRTVHLDPEIHEQPNEYIPTRYMTQKKPTKNGKLVMNHTIPFGGGLAACEGRYFARGELKALLTLLLMKYTVEVDPNSTERPTFFEGRMGIGLKQIKGDMRVIIRRREEP